jgi:hypothetical protein
VVRTIPGRRVGSQWSQPSPAKITPIYGPALHNLHQPRETHRGSAPTPSAPHTPLPRNAASAKRSLTPGNTDIALGTRRLSRGRLDSLAGKATYDG